MSKFVEQNDTKERALFQRCPNRIVISVRESRHFKGSDNEPSEMQIHAYSCQKGYWQRLSWASRDWKREYQQLLQRTSAERPIPLIRFPRAGR